MALGRKRLSFSLSGCTKRLVAVSTRQKDSPTLPVVARSRLRNNGFNRRLLFPHQLHPLTGHRILTETPRYGTELPVE